MVHKLREFVQIGPEMRNVLNSSCFLPVAIILLLNCSCIEGINRFRDYDALKECGIFTDTSKELATAFTFVEESENIPVGSVLATYGTSNVIDVKVVNTEKIDDYIHVYFDGSRENIQFNLTRPLPGHRESNWTPNIEVDYNVLCLSSGTNNVTKRYTFMLILENANTYKPEFVKTEYNLNIAFPWPTSIRLNNDEEIIAYDKDFSKSFADLTFSCVKEGVNDYCSNFDIRVGNSYEDKAYKYPIYLYMKNNSDLNKYSGAKQGETYSFLIEATDSVHCGSTRVNIYAETVPDSDKSFPLWLTIGVSVSGVIAVSLFGAVVYSRRKNMKQKDILKKLTEAEIREFIDGSQEFDSQAPKRSIDVNMPILAKPYNKAFEIPRDKLRIDETTVLGTGFFGVVMKGSVIRVNEESTTVAVKSVKRNVGHLYFKALLSELKIMSFIGKHSNIVSLIGACTHNIRKREVYIAVEYCSNGNLHNYLRAYRSNFVNMVKDGKFCVFKGSSAYSRKGSHTKQISTLDLVKWSMQISNGLEYLSSLGVIHGDLATRNILLDSDKVAKIADFGLSRRLVDVSNYYYTKQSQVPLPWKWMSIESLQDMKFSKKSDIWSFGIVLWEIFSLGQTPYGGMNWEETFVKRLQSGLRLAQPQYASDDIYKIMEDCWTENPHDRPSISDIKKILEDMSNALLTQNSAESGYFRVLGGDRYAYIAESVDSDDPPPPYHAATDEVTVEDEVKRRDYDC